MEIHRQPVIRAREHFAVEDVIDDAQSGKMVILVDATGEASLTMPARMATPDAINFMATHGRGLICLALTQARASELGIARQRATDEDKQRAAFAVSIEAREGVTTGISAYDRAHTIAVAVDARNGAESLVSPGHMFPIIATDGGVLMKAGHAEAAIDLSKLACVGEAGMMCQILDEEGEMANASYLAAFANRHGLKTARVTDLASYRASTEVILERTGISDLISEYGGHWRVARYINAIDDTEVSVLRKGDRPADRPVPVQFHILSLFDDILGRKAGRGNALQNAMWKMSGLEAGLIIIVHPQAGHARITPSRGGKHTYELTQQEIAAQVCTDMNVLDFTLVHTVADMRPTLFARDRSGFAGVSGHLHAA